MMDRNDWFKSAFGLAFCVLALLPAGSVAASDQDVLTITGPNELDRSFTMEELKQLPVSSFSTSTIWTEGVNEFTGVSLDDLLESVDMSGHAINAVALNDYAVEIPAEDTSNPDPIVAYSMNGKNMSVRDKGPLWIIYPYDTKVEYQSETTYSRSIWQLRKIEILD
jgi:hypothetical protein